LGTNQSINQTNHQQLTTDMNKQTNKQIKYENRYQNNIFIIIIRLCGVCSFFMHMYVYLLCTYMHM